jgi:pimeloyl-ACP methyl ester carboxylesterase
MTFANLADAAAVLLDHLETETAIIVGHSMGGMVAQEFPARHPSRLSALVLSGTSPAFGNPSGDWQKQFVADRMAPLDAGKTMADLAPELVAGMLGDDPDAEGVETAKAAMSRVREGTYRTAVQMLVTFDRRADLANIAVPTLVLAGEKDRNAPAAMMERMAAKIPGAHYHCLPGAGHLANLEQPAAFNAVLDTFLADTGAVP